MPQVIPGHKYRVGIADQTAEGTAASVADFRLPVYAGPAGPEEERRDHEVADGNAFRPGEYKARGWVSGTIEWTAFPDSLPRILAAHFGDNFDTVTGAADPFTHTQIRKDTPLFHTLWVGRPKADGTFEYDQLVDCIATAFEFRYSSGNLVRIATEILGKKSVGNATAPTFTTTNTLTASDFGYTWDNATLKIDLAATPAVTTINYLSEFVVRFAYNGAALEWTDDFFPRYFDIGQWMVGFSGTAIAEDWTQYNATFYGAAAPAANTDHSPSALRGSLDFLLAIGPTANANRTTQIQVPEIQFSVGRPEIDPAGRGIRFAMAGKLQAPASGEPATVITKNAVSAAYG